MKIKDFFYFYWIFKDPSFNWYIYTLCYHSRNLFILVKNKEKQSEIQSFSGNILQHPLVEKEPSVHYYRETKKQKQTKEDKF